MRPVPDRKQILEVARALGAVSYSKPPMRQIRGVSFTFEQLDQFVNKMINPNAVIVDVSESTGGDGAAIMRGGLCNEMPLPNGTLGDKTQ